jgi:predicted GH43/DUF377 family glycosyl hydrolase
MGTIFVFIFFALLIGAVALLGLIWRALGGHKLIERWRHPQLVRARQNPVLAPREHNKWENQAVFNPAAIYDGGRVHLLYRAMGDDGISRIGYASSPDGIHFDERLRFPAYVPPNRFSIPDKKLVYGPNGYAPHVYPSGGGWGGTEDPRMVKIEGKIYLSFVAFDGWGFVRMAFASITEGDFRKKIWNWDAPRLMSPPDQIHKNWVLFPELINGKFAIIHSISPKIQIEYRDSMDEFDGKNFLESKFHRVRNDESWDTFLRGVGPPPIRTDAGWLVLYHAVDERESDKYKLGAMLLDINDPTKILYRSVQPILEPNTWYENNGKPGIVYACGAVVLDGVLFVYYGGGDTSVNVATIRVDEIIDCLVHSRDFLYVRQSLTI